MGKERRIIWGRNAEVVESRKWLAGEGGVYITRLSLARRLPEELLSFRVELCADLQTLVTAAAKVLPVSMNIYVPSRADFALRLTGRPVFAEGLDVTLTYNGTLWDVTEDDYRW